MNLSKLNKLTKLNNKEYQGLLEQRDVLEEQYVAQFKNVAQDESIFEELESVSSVMDTLVAVKAFEEGQKSMYSKFDDIQVNLEDMKNVLGMFGYLLQEFDKEQPDQEFLANFKRMKSTLLFGCKSLEDACEFILGTNEAAFRDIENGLDLC